MVGDGMGGEGRKEGRKEREWNVRIGEKRKRGRNRKRKERSIKRGSIMNVRRMARSPVMQ